jgi:single-strand selective monofunctional uracil DNA glycosylase
LVRAPASGVGAARRGVPIARMAAQPPRPWRAYDALICARLPVYVLRMSGKSTAGPSAKDLCGISRQLSDRVSKLSFSDPVTHVYNPLAYARAPHEAYLRKYGVGPKQVVLLGMNPGPFGMAQTGVPFGDVAMVRGFLGIDEKVGVPRAVHEKRPVLGFGCNRREVSGSRLWGWAEQRFGSAERFFARFFVVNYCPLAFIEQSGKNRTPDKLPASEREPLFGACDRALSEIVSLLGPRHVVGVGAFATARAREVLSGSDVRVSTILHPSPQSPLANSGWAPRIEEQLRLTGIEL